MLSPVPPKMTEDPLSINAIMKMKIGHTKPTDKQSPLSFPQIPASPFCSASLMAIVSSAVPTA